MIYGVSKAGFHRIAEQLAIEYPQLTVVNVQPGQVITESHTDRKSTLLVRSSEPIRDPAWSAAPIDLEDLVLAYMGSAKQARAMAGDPR